MKKIFSLVLFSILLFLTGCQSGDNSYTYFIGYDNYEDFIEIKVSEFSGVVRVKMEANPNLKLDDVTLKVDLNLQSPLFGSTGKKRIELKASDTRQAMFDYEKTIYQYINFDIVSIHGLVSTNDDIDPELTIKQAPLKEIYKKVKDYQNSDTFYAKSSMKIDDIEEEMEVIAQKSPFYFATTTSTLGTIIEVKNNLYYEYELNSIPYGFGSIDTIQHLEVYSELEESLYIENAMFSLEGFGGNWDYQKEGSNYIISVKAVDLLSAIIDDPSMVAYLEAILGDLTYHMTLNFDQNIKLNLAFDNEMIDLDLNFEFSNEAKKVNTNNRNIVGPTTMDYETRILYLDLVNTEVVVPNYDAIHYQISGKLLGTYEITYPESLDIIFMNNSRYFNAVDIILGDELGTLKATFNLTEDAIYYIHVSANQAPIIANITITKK